MALEVTITTGRHAEAAHERFPSARLEAFHRADVLAALAGEDWLSILVADGRCAMLHVVAPQPIGDTGYADVEPWLGYAPPLFSADDPAFAATAFRAYSAAIAERGVVAELIRFDPLAGRPHWPASDQHVRLVRSRLIAYVPIRVDEDEQLSVYAPACRTRIRAGRAALRFCALAGDDDWASFRELNDSSLHRVGAAPRWHLDAVTFARLRRCGRVSLWGVRDDDELVCAALLVRGWRVATLLLLANGDVRSVRGAGELLTHGLTRTRATAGADWLCLGGGRTGDQSDSLLAFKAKFAGGNLRRLTLGVALHVPEVVERLNAQALARGVSPRSVQPSGDVVGEALSYRLLPEFANGAVAV